MHFSMCLKTHTRKRFENGSVFFPHLEMNTDKVLRLLPRIFHFWIFLVCWNHITSEEKISSVISSTSRISKAITDVIANTLRNYIFIKKFFITIKNIYACSSPQILMKVIKFLRDCTYFKKNAIVWGPLRTCFMKENIFYTPFLSYEHLS